MNSAIVWIICCANLIHKLSKKKNGNWSPFFPLDFLLVIKLGWLSKGFIKCQSWHKEERRKEFLV